MLCFTWKFMDSVEEFIIWSYFDPKLLFWDKENIFSHEPLLCNLINVCWILLYESNFAQKLKSIEKNCCIYYPKSYIFRSIQSNNQKNQTNNRSYVLNSCIWNDFYTSTISLNSFCVYHCSYSLNHSPLDIKPSIGFLSCIKTRIYDVISKGSSECL